ncbi:MAG TPA: hypothetical protein VEI46_07025 [Thermodesulfovibrionales bacterium]|nr:hypothetical protein [Thermodesulfovibrionales bacterium]
MAELGKIERPDAGSFSGKRKLYCVANVYPLKDGPDDYKRLVERYWSEVTEQTEKLEAAGKIKKVYCESISGKEEEAYRVLAQLNEKALGLVKKKVEEGAMLFSMESEEIFGPFLDWTNCLNVVRTREVFMKILEFYDELSDKRLRHAVEVIEGNLADGEAGLLIMRDEDRIRLQLAPDIEIFLVTPPSYDDILRWFREKAKDVNSGKEEA